MGRSRDSSPPSPREPGGWSRALAVHLHGLGHAHPEPEITNRFLESLEIGTDDAWILERVGIRSRRTVLPLDYIRTTRNRDPRAALEAATESNATLGARAARLALERAGIAALRHRSRDRGQLGRRHERARRGLQHRGRARHGGARVRRELGVHELLRAALRDVDDGSGAAARLDPARRRPRRSPPRSTTTTAPRPCSGATRRPRRSCRLRHPGRATVLSNELASSPAAREKVLIPRGGHFRQEGRAVQMFGIKRMVQGAHAAARRVRARGAPVPLRRPPGESAHARERAEHGAASRRSATTPTSSGTAIPARRARRACCR